MRRSVVSLLTAAIMLPAAIAAMPEVDVEVTPVAPTSVDELSAARTGSTLEINGTAAYGGIDELLIGDYGADNTPTGTASEMGVKISAVTIAQPDVESGDLVFTYHMEDASTSQVPEFVQYYWDFGIKLPGEGVEALQISGKATSSSGSPAFTLDSDCATEGNTFDCASSRDIDASFDAAANTVTVTVPMELLEKTYGPLDGAAIVPAKLFSGIAAQPSLIVGNLSNTGYEILPDRDFPVGRTVTLTLTDAADTVVAETTVTADDATFSGTLDVTEVAPGPYTLTATACWSANCGATSIDVDL